MLKRIICGFIAVQLIFVHCLNIVATEETSPMESEEVIETINTIDNEAIAEKIEVNESEEIVEGDEIMQSEETISSETSELSSGSNNEMDDSEHVFLSNPADFVIDANKVLTQYTGTDTEVTIPDGVVKIGYASFQGKTTITKVVMPNTVTVIDSYAFNNCTSLSEIPLSTSLTSINYSSFAGCTSLKTIHIPKTLVNFTGYWPSIENVTFESGTTSVIGNLFENTPIESIVLPDTITTIQGYAFRGCTKLKDITWSMNLKVIGGAAFLGCTSLVNATLPEGLTEIHDSVFYNCTNLADVTLPDSLLKIGSNSFYSCFNIREITVPANITSSGYAFNNCTNLTTIKFKPDTKKVPDNLFNTVPGLVEITLPDSITQIGAASFHNCFNLKTINWPRYLISIGDKAFKYCHSLIDVRIPDTVTTIGGSAFSNCTNLSTLKISNNIVTMDESFQNLPKLTSIFIPKTIVNGSNAFLGSNNLKNVILQEGIKTIPNSLLCNLPGIEEIILPNSVEAISDYAFHSCANLKNIHWSSSLTSIYKQAFYNCDSLTHITLPDSVAGIAENAFSYSDNLREVSFGKGLTYMEHSVLKECPNLQKVTFNSPMSIPEYTFLNCIRLSEVNLFEGIKSINYRGFYNCKNLTTINLPNGLTTIGESAFEKTGLINQVIPDSVYLINHYAFRDCTNLETITLGKGLITIGTEVFRSNVKLQTIELPTRVKTLGDRVFLECPSLQLIKMGKAITTIGANLVSYVNVTKIKGYEGTVAQTYATTNGIAFEAMSSKPTTQIDTPDRYSIVYFTAYEQRYLPLKIRLLDEDGNETNDTFTITKNYGYNFSFNHETQIATFSEYNVGTNVAWGYKITTSNGITKDVVVNAGLKYNELTYNIVRNPQLLVAKGSKFNPKGLIINATDNVCEELIYSYNTNPTLFTFTDSNDNPVDNNTVINGDMMVKVKVANQPGHLELNYVVNTVSAEIMDGQPLQLMSNANWNSSYTFSLDRLQFKENGVVTTKQIIGSYLENVPNYFKEVNTNCENISFRIDKNQGVSVDTINLVVKVNGFASDIMINIPVNVITNTRILGDISGTDNEITVDDINSIVMHINKVFLLSDTLKPYADVNADGRISITDVVMIQNHILNVKFLTDY